MGAGTGELSSAATPSDQALGHCRRVLHQNWRTGEFQGRTYSYTSPSPHRYPWQWYWDSCLTASRGGILIAPEPGRSWSLCWTPTPDGFIGHTIFWGHPVPFPRRALFYNIRSTSDPMTWTIQPPLLAWAWQIAVGDPASEPRIQAHHDLVQSQRDLEGNGLLWILQPDESGLDASPSFDAVWGWRADGLPGFPLLVRRNRRLGFDIQRVREAGGPAGAAAPWSTCCTGSPVWLSGGPRLPRR